MCIVVSTDVGEHDPLGGGSVQLDVGGELVAGKEVVDGGDNEGKGPSATDLSRFIVVLLGAQGVKEWLRCTVFVGSHAQHERIYTHRLLGIYIVLKHRPTTQCSETQLVK